MCLLVLSLGLAIVAAPSRPAVGIDCWLPGGLPGAIKSADVVFTGRVVSTRQLTLSSASARESAEIPALEVRVAVDSVWKGTLPPIVTVRQHLTAEDVSLDRGHRYLLFARYSPHGFLFVQPSCAGTRPWPVSRAERDTLGRSWPPSRSTVRSGQNRNRAP